jgi:hypothetical protein
MIIVLPEAVGAARRKEVGKVWKWFPVGARDGLSSPPVDVDFVACGLGPHFFSLNLITWPFMFLITSLVVGPPSSARWRI